MTAREALVVVLLITLGSILGEAFGSMLGFFACVVPGTGIAAWRFAAWGLEPPRG